MSMSTFFPQVQRVSIDDLAAKAIALDPARSELLRRWTAWFGHATNAELIGAHLTTVHGDGASNAEQLRSSVGVLEHMSSASSEIGGPLRVPPIEESEAQSRVRLADWVEVAAGGASPDADLDDESVEWAIELLRNGASGKGLGRRLRELIESSGPAISELLRANRALGPSAEPESPAKTARALTKSRGNASHGTGTSSIDFGWRADQARLLVLALVLLELGLPDDRVRRLVTSLSTTQCWWDRDDEGR